MCLTVVCNNTERSDTVSGSQGEEKPTDLDRQTLLQTTAVEAGLTGSAECMGEDNDTGRKSNEGLNSPRAAILSTQERSFFDDSIEEIQNRENLLEKYLAVSPEEIV